jgi:NADH-quinone oxidoreductase subunit M
MMILFLILWPLATSLGLYAFRPANAKYIAFVSSLIELVVSLLIAIQFSHEDAAKWAYQVPWVPSLGINFSVGMDGISLLLVLLTTGLVPFILLSSFDMPNQKSANFYALVLLMQMALVGVFTALDGFLFYVFWEMALIPIYFICLIWGDENRVPVTFKFFVYTLAGSLFMLLALLFLYYQTPGNHSFDIQALYKAGRGLPTFQQGIIFWSLFTLGNLIPTRWHRWKVPCYCPV